MCLFLWWYLDHVCQSDQCFIKYICSSDSEMEDRTGSAFHKYHIIIELFTVSTAHSQQSEAFWWARMCTKSTNLRSVKGSKRVEISRTRETILLCSYYTVCWKGLLKQQDLEARSLTVWHMNHIVSPNACAHKISSTCTSLILILLLYCYLSFLLLWGDIMGTATLMKETFNCDFLCSFRDLVRGYHGREHGDMQADVMKK